MNKVREFVIEYFYVIVMLLSFICFKYNIPSFIKDLTWIVLFICFYKCVKIKNIFDHLILIYTFCGILSIIGYSIKPYPFEFFIKILLSSYLPIIFYFIGKNYRHESLVFYKYSVLACLGCFLIGFFWLVTMPEWYVTKALEVINQTQYYTEETLHYARFSSFLDSYHIGNLGTFSIICCIGLINTVKKKTGVFLYIVCLIVSFIAVFLSRQRVSMCLSIFFLLCFIWGKIRNRPILTFSIISCLIVIIIFFYPESFTLDSISSTERLSKESLSTLFSSRSGQWINALNEQRDFVFGHGLGGGGHLAMSVNIKPTVVDGSYSKILLETGIMSIFVFIGLIILSIFKALRFRKIRMELCIVLYYAASLIGANIIDMPYIIVPLWYSIGRISGYSNIGTKSYLPNKNF